MSDVTMEIGCPHGAWGMIVPCPHCGSPRTVTPSQHVSDRFLSEVERGEREWPEARAASQERPQPDLRDEMREALDEVAEAFPVNEISDAPWVVERGSIAWMVREGEGGPQVGNFILEADARWVAAQRNALDSLSTDMGE